MSISNLSKKTSSPQTWRKRSNHRPRRGSSFGKSPLKGKKLKIKLPENFTRLALTVGVAAIGLGGLFTLALVGWIARDLPDPNKIIDRSVAESTKIFDRTGETLLFDIHGTEQRTVVKLEDIPEFVVQATLTAEDRNFYEHKGISITGIMRSVVKNIFTGSKVGGSTLTQQLVKNAILSPEKTYTRKIKEVILSWQIEKRFSKQEILQLYFNEIPYGSVAYGAEAAAQTYLGKSIRDVNLAEAAILAALPQAPTYYSPYGNNVDALFARQAWILDSMAELGYITKEDAQFAKSQEIEFKLKKDNIIAPHFVFHVKEYLTEKYGELAVEQGGLQVITTLDLYKHEIAQEVIDEVAEKNLDYNATNAALVAIDTKTGEVLTMIGSKDYFDDEIDGQVNVATRLRQPGSSFKPIVYTAALKKGYTPDTILYDVETVFQNYDLRDYTPKNYDLSEHGPVTIRKALAGSLNIPAVKAIYLTGVDNVIDLAEDLGYTSLTNRSRFGLSLVLGGGEVQLLEHVNAFATLAREGEYHQLVTVLEVKDKNGNVLEKHDEFKGKKVLDTQIARQINSMMSDNNARAYVFGQNNYLNLGARPVAAKTGTTNDYRDAWTVGYTPSLAVGVWVGNNNNEPMSRGAAGGAVAAPIWNKFMSRVLGNTPIETFKEYDEIKTDKAVLNGSIANGVTVKVNKANGKIATNQTPEELVEERTYKQVHSILHYIDKDDPQGNSKPDTSSEQYKRWEEAVQKWAEENNITSEEPPTEIDNSNSKDRPSIEFTSPSKSTTISSRNLSASINVSAPRGVKKVEYYLEGNIIQTVNSEPFNLNVFVADPKVTTGFYKLRAIAYDDIGNSNSTSIDVNFNLPSLPPVMAWDNISNNQELQRSYFPLTLSADILNINETAEISVFANGAFIGRSISFPGNKLFIEWSLPPAENEVTVYAEIKRKDGYTFKAAETKLIIK